MASHHERVDGVVLPVRLAGHPALELCNSYAGWGEHPGGDTGDEPGDRRDYLRSYDVLAVLAGHAEILDAAAVAELRAAAATAPGPARRVLLRAREFRAALYAFVTAGRPPGPDAATRAALAAELTRARASAAPAFGDPPDDRLTWRVDAAAGLAAPLLAFALAADDLLGRTATAGGAGSAAAGGVADVRACGGPDCGWLFLDPAGRRRWCSMASCGNRAKARRFAARETGRAPVRRPDGRRDGARTAR